MALRASQARREASVLNSPARPLPATTASTTPARRVAPSPLAIAKAEPPPPPPSPIKPVPHQLPAEDVVKPKPKPRAKRTSRAAPLYLVSDSEDEFRPTIRRESAGSGSVSQRRTVGPSFENEPVTVKPPPKKKKKAKGSAKSASASVSLEPVVIEPPKQLKKKAAPQVSDPFEFQPPPAEPAKVAAMKRFSGKRGSASSPAAEPVRTQRSEPKPSSKSSSETPAQDPVRIRLTLGSSPRDSPVRHDSPPDEDTTWTGFNTSCEALRSGLGHHHDSLKRLSRPPPPFGFAAHDGSANILSRRNLHEMHWISRGLRDATPSVASSLRDLLQDATWSVGPERREAHLYRFLAEHYLWRTDDEQPQEWRHVKRIFELLFEQWSILVIGNSRQQTADDGRNDSGVVLDRAGASEGDREGRDLMDETRPTNTQPPSPVTVAKSAHHSAVEPGGNSRANASALEASTLTIKEREGTDAAVSEGGDPSDDGQLTWQQASRQSRSVEDSLRAMSIPNDWDFGNDSFVDQDVEDQPGGDQDLIVRGHDLVKTELPLEEEFLDTTVTQSPKLYERQLQMQQAQLDAIAAQNLTLQTAFANQTRELDELKAIVQEQKDDLRLLKRDALSRPYISSEQRQPELVSSQPPPPLPPSTQMVSIDDHRIVLDRLRSLETDIETGTSATSRLEAHVQRGRTLATDLDARVHDLEQFAETQIVDNGRIEQMFTDLARHMEGQLEAREGEVRRAGREALGRVRVLEERVAMMAESDEMHPYSQEERETEDADGRMHQEEDREREDEDDALHWLTGLEAEEAAAAFDDPVGDYRVERSVDDLLARTSAPDASNGDSVIFQAERLAGLEADADAEDLDDDHTVEPTTSARPTAGDFRRKQTMEPALDRPETPSPRSVDQEMIEAEDAPTIITRTKSSLATTLADHRFPCTMTPGRPHAPDIEWQTVDPLEVHEQMAAKDEEELDGEADEREERSRTSPSPQLAPPHHVSNDREDEEDGDEGEEGQEGEDTQSTRPVNSLPPPPSPASPVPSAAAAQPPSPPRGIKRRKSTALAPTVTTAWTTTTTGSRADGVEEFTKRKRRRVVYAGAGVGVGVAVVGLGVLGWLGATL
ncbi:hypothetical protein HKX48_007846 [Thoreauomyces humboldtii]|nr:hypothetical protein HKX48_007846 [Thoreauomyces humboldtii]